MLATTEPPAASRRRAESYELRRKALVSSALQTLAELGYARTSVRDIAQNSDYSHGVLHYYFADKAELIDECIRRYDETSEQRFAALPTSAATANDYADAVAEAFAGSLVTDSAEHRLWYDLRTQSMFDDQLRDAVSAIDAGRSDKVWSIVTRFGELAGTSPSASPDLAYQVLDGVLQHHVIGYALGDDTAPARLADAIREALLLLVRPPSPSVTRRAARR